LAVLFLNSAEAIQNLEALFPAELGEQFQNLAGAHRDTLGGSGCSGKPGGRNQSGAGVPQSKTLARSVGQGALCLRQVLLGTP
jgi:hypothetical protein